MRKPWTKEDDQILIELYPNNFSKDIAEKLNRSIPSIYTRANLLKLNKTPEFMKFALQREAEKLQVMGEKTRFVKGVIPKNKGKKMSIDQYERVKYTFFKKGNIPPNATYDGHIRVCKKDGYHYIRIALGKYVLKHRYIYEQHYGKINDGWVVIFLDGNKLNFDINNLKAISKQEHVRRNRVHEYPQEIKDLIKLKNKLKKQINEKQN